MLMRLIDLVLKHNASIMLRTSERQLMLVRFPIELNAMGLVTKKEEGLVERAKTLGARLTSLFS